MTAKLLLCNVGRPKMVLPTGPMGGRIFLLFFDMEVAEVGRDGIKQRGFFT